MKKINNNIISFIGEIIFQHNLGDDFITDKMKNSNYSDMLEKTLDLFFNEKVIARKKNGENLFDFHPLSKLTAIINDLINNLIEYDELRYIISKEMVVSQEIAEKIYLSIKENEDIKTLIEAKDILEDVPLEEEDRKRILKSKSIASEFLK